METSHEFSPITHIPGLLMWRMCARIYEGCRFLPHGKIPRRGEPMSAAGGRKRMEKKESLKAGGGPWPFRSKLRPS